MSNSKFNFATVFAIMVLLIFAYITFLGLVYWNNGDLILPLCLTLGFIFLVMALVMVMCKAKATRWLRLGKIGQIICGALIMVLFVLAAVPFTNFLRVAGDSDNIERKIKSACNSAVGLDQAYQDYVDGRAQLYQDSLVIISQNKLTFPSLYKERIQDAAGVNDTEKIASVISSMKRHLVPDSTSVISKERHQWLVSAQNTSVWNPLMASNIRHIDDVVNDWIDNYKELAATQFIGEHAPAFEYADFSSKVSTLTKTYTEMRWPSIISIIIALVSFFIMLLPYIVTEKSLAAKTTDNSCDYE